MTNCFTLRRLPTMIRRFSRWTRAKDRLSLCGVSLAAEIILIDDRRGATVARAKGFEILGTLGVLSLAARRGMIDLEQALTPLRATNFRRREDLFDQLLRKYKGDTR